MVLTVRQRGQLLTVHGDKMVDDVIATVWFDQDEDTGPWGGIIEPQLAASLLRAQVLAGQRRYYLQLEDGRSGLLDLSLSQFEADGAHPVAFTGVGTLTRKHGSTHG